MTIPTLKHGVIDTLDEAIEAASRAEREQLLGYYPAACIVLSRALADQRQYVAWLVGQLTQSDNACPY